MTTTFALLRERCGLSQNEAADLFGVRLDTIKSWSIGRRSAPAAVIEQLRALYAKIETAADEAVKLLRKHRGATVELGLASDDHEAQAPPLRWPCVGAQAAMLGIVAARLRQEVIIVPRGSTPATAAAADAHERRRR